MSPKGEIERIILDNPLILLIILSPIETFFSNSLRKRLKYVLLSL